MRYAVVIEKSFTGFCAYVPDLPGCVAAANTRDELVRLIRGSIELHIDRLKEDGRSIPPPAFSVELVDVPA